MVPPKEKFATLFMSELCTYILFSDRKAAHGLLEIFRMG